MSIATTNRQQSARLAEWDLLVCMFANPDEIPDIRDQIRADDFHHAAHQFIYLAALRLHDRRQPVDATGTHLELQAAGNFADVPIDMLGELAGAWTSGANAQFYIDRVLSLARLRGLAHATQETLAEIEGQIGSPEELLERAADRLDQLTNRVAGPASVPVNEAVARSFSNLDARMSGKRTGVATGFGRLDDDTGGGLQDGQLATLGARPSVGKTSFALQIARNVCARNGSVFFVSLEQPESELTDRILAAEARVNGLRIRTGRLSDDEVKRLSQAADPIRSWGWRLQINDRPGQTAGQIATAARRARRKVERLDMIVVDYLQLVSPENSKVNRNEQVGHTTRRLREMARELGVPVLLLCQLNRAAEEREIPRLHHLRDSGEIEQHSDLVMFLHRAEARQPGRPDVIDLHVAKQRNGPLTAMRFEHESSTFTFRDGEGIPQ